jgi:deoxyadenosine/deoxycytidine kinase
VVIVIGGMIGLGKTTTAKILNEEMKIPVYYESVDDNKVLPLFYSATKEEIETKRYAFLLQLNFLISRYRSIKKALTNDNAILDRSIYEDHYFASKNKDLGRISPLEMEIYESLLKEFLSDLEIMPKKAPDVMIYLKGSFDTVLERIKERGRSYEIAPDLVDYYHFLWKDYDTWINKSYTASPIITLDVDKTDILNNLKDRQELVALINSYYKNSK